MRSEHYEELCRIFIAEQCGLNLRDIHSLSVPNPTRPNLLEFSHQIDLYWEQNETIAQYINIANAKWRANDKVDQPDVLLLQQVRQSVSAHKAFMLTSVGFTEGALASAQFHGIALHVVKPGPEALALLADARAEAATRLQELGSELGRPLYSFTVIHRGLDTGAPTAIQRPGPSRPAVGQGPGLSPGTFVRPAGPPPMAPSQGGSVSGSRPMPNFGPGLTKR